MARVVILPESDTLGTVDARELSKSHQPPTVEPKTGAPSLLRPLVVSQDPRIVVVPHFLSAAECRHVRELADGNWTRSLVGVFDDTGSPSSTNESRRQSKNGVQANTRTSSSCMLRIAQTAVIERLEQRLASLAKLPINQLERLAVVKYAPGEYFSEHHDGKFRPITVFIYLNDLPPNDEGDTFFPSVGLSFVPREGCAVMWSNATPEGTEDSRMVHAGRPPLTGTKYGINCFFNEEPVRNLHAPIPVSYGQVRNVDVRGLCKLGEQHGKEETMCTFALQSEPKVVAMPCFANDDEVDHLLKFLRDVERKDNSFFSDGTVPLRILEPEETEEVRQLERRLATVCHSDVECLWPLRLVESGTTCGMCNRCIGRRCALICLSDNDEVLFPHLGLQLQLARGDLLTWPNAWYTQRDSDAPDAKERYVEDLRTMRLHIGSGKQEQRPSLSVDASFDDAPVRTRLNLGPKLV
mmetsp:Transcript_51667/g.102720  ORF Transcript_51667/g.102720 Transcript_51667/m.102720 type:complete len:467 (-) Transcript_51667:98-1498(-)|eukprot:CAMPEP_0172722814 /NCGR_PEP_ID=MMETSP1074-20121228/82362_1 /TAXON_ID=2916 /ORGANISM="Ceratium fusus, Strain PA161109" /LENGTH=466 /DNA_ID=CAMNT_0013548901 /DNA_START=41 /DNA_END=1441 /DNA_ORIENTATION=+